MIELSLLLIVGLAWWRCCCDGGCSVCTDGTTPTSVDVEFGSVVDGTCLDCSQTTPNGYNFATYNLTKVSACLWTGPGECSHTIALTVDFDTGFFWLLEVSDSGSSVIATFKGAQSNPTLDCSTAETGISITTGNNTECDWTNATCDILPQ